MEIDLIQLNKLLRFVRDSEQQLVTMSQQLQYLREVLEGLHRIELAHLIQVGQLPRDPDATQEGLA